MKTIGNFPFPDCNEDDWKPVIRYRALHGKVLVVATTRTEGAWKAYCSNVPGKSHEREIEIPLTEGDDIGEKLARCMFPEFAELPYAR